MILSFNHKSQAERWSKLNNKILLYEYGLWARKQRPWAGLPIWIHYYIIQQKVCFKNIRNGNMQIVTIYFCLWK